MRALRKKCLPHYSIFFSPQHVANNKRTVPFMAAVFPNFHNGRYAKCLKRDSGMGVGGWGVFSRAPPLCERGGDVIDRSSISIGCHSSARRRGERERERRTANMRMWRWDQKRGDRHAKRE